jgi:hypothetical protein
MSRLHPSPMRSHRKEWLLGARTTPVDVSAIMASILAEEKMDVEY